jgi:hypothetical protein
MVQTRGKEALIERARAAVARLSGGHAIEWRCTDCGGLGDESRHECAHCRTGSYRHRPCLTCNGFGLYWRIHGTAVVYSVAEVLHRPDLRGGALHDH